MNTKKHLVCRSCGNQFDSEYDRIYCSETCRRREKTRRYRERKLGVEDSWKTTQHIERSNPTEVELNAFAKLVLEGAFNDEPVIFTNVRIMWIPPKGIDFVKQVKLRDSDPDTWAMVKHVPTLQERLTEATNDHEL